ncbi:MAG: hypothetical protein ABR598_03810, partial [Candidatus Dormibacteria bacterium]
MRRPGRGAFLALAGVGLLTAGVLVVPRVIPLGVALQGAILGAGTGLMAVGLVLTYRSSGIINFAYGAMGGLPAAVAVALFRGHGVSWPLALVAAIFLGVGLGAAVERLVVRRLVTAPRLTTTIATIGLAEVLGGLEALVPRLLGGPTLVAPFRTPLDQVHVSISPVLFTGNDLLLLAVVPACLGGLTWFVMGTETGLAVRGM